MRAGAINLSPLSAMAGAMRAQHRAMLTRHVLDAAGLLDADLARSLAFAEASAQAVARGSVEIARARMSGSLIDLLA